MVLPKLFWRRYRCADCGHLFELPLDDVTLPAHAPRGRRDAPTCPGGDSIPA